MAQIIVGSKKLGIEFAFAISSYFLIVLVNHFVTLRSGVESFIFYVVAIYNVLMYCNIAFSNPGQITPSQKQQINQKFYKLEGILAQSKKDPEGYLPVFESEIDSILFNNYFLPKDLLNSQNSDLRQFRFCQKCQLYKLPRMHHCSQCNQCCVKYDHHCGMAINCIGINNYHLFIVFLSSTIFFILFSLIMNLKNTFVFWNISTYSWMGVISSIVLLIHNLGAAYYAYALFHWYLSMSLKNMHSVEETSIGAVYDKARFHKIAFGEMKKFYYTRPSFLKNWCEMMGTRNVFRWITPLPYRLRQNHNLWSKERCEVEQLGYMRFDKDSMRELVSLEYKIEKKIEQDLINSGFKIKRKIQIPKHLENIIGVIKED